MIATTLYVLFFAVMASFMWWRFYVSARDQVATVKWARYRRADEPITYWLSTSLMAIGAILPTLLAVTFAHGVAAGFIG